MTTATESKQNTSNLAELVKSTSNPAMQRLAENIERKESTVGQAYSRQHHRHNRS